MKKSVEIDIPAGVNEGFTIQIQGEGSFDKKKQASVAHHIYFEVY